MIVISFTTVNHFPAFVIGIQFGCLKVNHLLSHEILLLICVMADDMSH